MPTERMEEVEVVVTCTRCGGMSPACWVCEKSGGKEVALLPVAPGSLTEARLRLADAAVRREDAHDAKQARITSGVDCSVDRQYFEALEAEDGADMDYWEALAALRTARGEG